MLDKKEKPKFCYVCAIINAMVKPDKQIKLCNHEDTLGKKKIRHG